jgi:hypothetical protein
VLAAPRPEPVREPDEVRLVNRVEHFHHRALDDFVLDRRDSQWPLPPIRFGDELPPRGLRAIRAVMNAPVQVYKAILKALPILFPRHPIDSRCCAPLQPEVRAPQQIDIDVVEQGGEPLLLIGFRSLSHTAKSL